MLFVSITNVISNDQFTPEQTNWKTFQSKPLAQETLGHDPDSVKWITKAQWEAAEVGW